MGGPVSKTGIHYEAASVQKITPMAYKTQIHAESGKQEAVVRMTVKMKMKMKINNSYGKKQ